ncbi:MAG: amino acid permease [Planctomycetes bacterium]|nr:amino acid permease [Planctomycetota bacterium]
MTDGQLQRRLGLTSAISITVGAVIGSGIFLTPLKAAQNVPSEGWLYLLWIGLGVVCLFGAFAYAELGTLFPEAGGQYSFLREAWGGGTAFLYGWVFFWVINSGTVAALAVAFADALLPVLGVERTQFAAAGTASAMIVLLALVNHFGVLLGAVLQNVATFAKVGALALLVVGGVWLALGSGVETTVTPTKAAPGLSMNGMVAAFIAIFWAYEGWYQLPFNAAELKRPARDLPLGLILGMVLLIAVYAAVNAIYLYAVPFGEMQTFAPDDKQRVPVEAIARIFSPEISHYLTVLIAISVMGAANPNFLSSPRAFYAMAQDGLVPAALHKVSPRWGTPAVSIWTQAAWAVVLVVVLESFQDITAFVVFAGFLFYALTVAGVYRLRARRPDLPRPYRCTGYPVTPALFIAVSVGFVAALLLDPGERKNALIGLGILATGVPYYAWWTRRRGRTAA